MEAPPTHIELTDGQTYTNDTNMDLEQITYSRIYKNTNWQAWYVPFDLEVTSDLLSQFSFAKFAGTYTEEDGEGNPIFYITILRLKAGDVVKANTPYFIKAASTNNNNPQVISVSDATLKAAAETGFEMNSAEKKITIRGIYSTKTATEEDHDWYAYGGGQYIHAVVGQSLSPYRFFLTITDREDNPYGSTHNPNNIKVKLVGDDGEMTDIEDVSFDFSEEKNGRFIYDLSGRRIMNDKLESGIYIINGKKVFVK